MNERLAITRVVAHCRDPEIVGQCRTACEQLRWSFIHGDAEPPTLLGGGSELHVVEHFPELELPNGLGQPTGLIICDAGALPNLLRRSHAFGAYQLRPLRIEPLKEQLRRLGQGREGNLSQCISFGSIFLDSADRRVVWQGKLLSLTWREFDLLRMLVINGGNVVARDRIEASIYRWGQVLGSNAIEVYVHAIRQKTNPSLIETVHGIGYVVNEISTHKVS